jgi:hypothetical protein
LSVLNRLLKCSKLGLGRRKRGGGLGLRGNRKNKNCREEQGLAITTHVYFTPKDSQEQNRDPRICKVLSGTNRTVTAAINGRTRIRKEMERSPLERRPRVDGLAWLNTEE